MLSKACSIFSLTSTYIVLSKATWPSGVLGAVQSVFLMIVQENILTTKTNNVFFCAFMLGKGIVESGRLCVMSGAMVLWLYHMREL